jgi:hypothetical protein
LIADAITLAYAVYMSISFNSEDSPENDPVASWELVLLVAYICDIVLKIFASGVTKYFMSWWKTY